MDARHLTNWSFCPHNARGLYVTTLPVINPTSATPTTNKTGKTPLGRRQNKPFYIYRGPRKSLYGNTRRRLQKNVEKLAKLIQIEIQSLLFVLAVFANRACFASLFWLLRYAWKIFFKKNVPTPPYFIQICKINFTQRVIYLKLVPLWHFRNN